MSIAEHRLSLPAGYELGKYHFKELLGSGGFGITYLAEDQTLNRRVAIKELLPNDIATRIDGTTVAAKTKGDEGSLEWARERFVNEGRALAACEHPNVVHVYEIIEANGTAYMVTKYEEGCSLEKWLADLGRAPNEWELRGIITPLLSGLEQVHEKGFLHRDIKPENIYMTSGGRPLLLDFGSARQAVSNRSMAMTSIVSSGYAPFEQYYEDGNQGPWSDIYALGAVIYRAITGKKPPEATRRQKDDTCEKLAARYTGQYSAGFLTAIDRALAITESERPQTVAQWRAMLNDDPLDATTLVQKKPPPPKPGFLDFIKQRLWIGATAGVLLIVSVAGILSSRRPQPVTQPEPSPEKAAQSAPEPTPTPPVRNEIPQQMIESDKMAIAEPANPPPEDKNTATPEPSPAAPVPEASPVAAAQESPAATPIPGLDPRIAGSWQSGTTKEKREHWQLWTNGYWLMWGPINDSGTFTADAGLIRQYSDNTGQWTEASYEYEDGTLVTHNAMGSATWHHPPSAGSDSGGTRKKHKSNQDSPVKAFFGHLFHSPSDH